MYFNNLYISIFFIFNSLNIQAKRQSKSKIEKRKNNEEYLLDNDVPKILPETYNRPVNFEQVEKHGFGDVEFKQPIDFLELYMTMPKSRAHASNLLKTFKDTENIQWIKSHKPPPVFLSPRDEMLHYKINTTTNVSARNQRLYDFAKILEANIGTNRQNKKTLNSKSTTSSTNPPKENIKSYFNPNTFSLKSNSRHKNWTTCNEFAKNAQFHPNDIVFTDWVPFYMWSPRAYPTANVHRFVYPTKKNMEYYKKSFGPYMRKLDWKQPALLFVEPTEMLLLAGDRKGLFYGIIKQEFPSGAIGQNISISPVTIRLKIIDPYLAMTHCDEKYAIIMAESGTEPLTDDDKYLEANKLKFRGIGRPISRDLMEERNMADIEMKRKTYVEDRKYINVDKGFSR